jgi:hypothetical protein
MKETLDQFVERLKREADEFAENWRGNVRDFPDEYPVAMTPDEWDEQFFTTQYT